MSTDGDSGPGRREVAYRMFAAEFDDASLSYSESDEERAPNYVVTPTGLRVNRLFAVGVLTEVESINEDTLRGRIVDPTGAFVTYAGQYQPPAQAFLDQTAPPAFVAITGKARTFEPEDSDRVFTSVRPESLSEVEAATRDRWVVSAAEATLQRIAICAAAVESSIHGEKLQTALSEAGVDASLAAGIPRALDHYGTTTAYLDGLRQVAIDALELVADERDEVRSLDVAPDEDGDVNLGPLPAVDIDLGGETTNEAVGEDLNESDMPTAKPSETPTEPTDTEPEPTVDEPEKVDMTAEPSTEPPTETANGAADSDASASTDSETDSGSAVDDSTGVDETGMYQLDEAEREQLESEYGTDFSSGNEVDPAGEADIDVPDADELAEKAESEAQTTADETAASATPEADTSEADTPEADTPEVDTSDDSSGETLGDFDDGLGDFEGEESVADSATESDSTAEGVDASEATTETQSDDDTPTAADGPPSSEESPSTEDLDLEETVIETMRERDDGDGVDRDQLVTEVVETYGVDETAVEEAIADALMGGRCYEPADDILKAI